MFENLSLLIGGSAHPLQVLFKLFSGFSGGVTLPKPLPSPQELRDQKDLISRRYDGITVLRQIPSFSTQDTATASVYRMCEFLCANDSNQLMLEVQYFWDHPRPDLWALEMLPDPRDDDAERYAILASLVESLVLAFNYRLKLGLRRKLATENSTSQLQENCPYWTSQVLKLQNALILYEDDIFASISENPFRARNIVANAGNLFSV